MKPAGNPATSETAAQHQLVLLHSAAGAIAFMTWISATVLFPVISAVWIVRVKAEPALRRYSPRLWSMVFPLGMYSACTFEMVNTFGNTGLRTYATVLSFVAFAAATAVTSLGLFTLYHARSAH